MPLTPFHYPAAYVLYKLNKKLSLPGLVVGSMFPDLEIPVLILLYNHQIPNHLLLHSLLGALTLGTFLSVVFTVGLYPFLTSKLFGVAKPKVKAKCRLSLSLVSSALFGNLSHVLLDVTNHAVTPILWPFISNSMMSPVPPIFGGVQNTSIVVQVLLVIILVIIIVESRNNYLERLLVE